MKGKRLIALAPFALCLAIGGQAWGDDVKQVPAVLAGHAVLPASSTVEVPEDAPSDLRVAGKYTTGKRVTELGAVMGKSANRETGKTLPIKGQSRQGHSGIKRMTDGSYWVLTDNGFGSKANSPDSMLFLTKYEINFATGKVKPAKTIFLHDPDHNVPFHIVNESTERRYLTGSDFDTESFQFAGGYLWLGDEFGPYLIKADEDGKVLAIFETKVDGKVVKSPDNPTQSSPGKPHGATGFQVSRSKGFEGMASSPDGKKLYPLLEGALWNEEKDDYERIDDAGYLRILEFDVEKEDWTGRSWKFVLEDNAHAIGDFNMIDDSHGLIIERDNGEGTSDKTCAVGASDTTHCFSNPAVFKRIYRVALSDSNAGGPVEKQSYVDLMSIEDPKKLARKPLTNGKLTFPFFTIENVDVVDKEHIIVGNDNNYPFSSSREPNIADDNEFILLSVPDLLKP